LCRTVFFINAGNPPASGSFNQTAYQLYSVKGNNVLHIQTTTYAGRSADAARRAVAARPLKAVDWRPTTRPGYSFNYNPDVRHNPLIYRLGFRFSHSMYDGSPSFPGFTEARLPHWLFALLFAAPPTVFLIRARRKPVNRCQSCGYDLRATPDRCPGMRNRRGIKNRWGFRPLNGTVCHFRLGLPASHCRVTLLR
jgi:hypothetical protein